MGNMCIGIVTIGGMIIVKMVFGKSRGGTLKTPKRYHFSQKRLTHTISDWQRGVGEVQEPPFPPYTHAYVVLTHSERLISNMKKLPNAKIIFLLPFCW
jgi:hypothetical protein